MINTADARSFTDYTFLVVTGDPSVNFLQRSPLSAYPVIEELPGVLGYFQVDTHGTFSSPLLPPEGSDPENSESAPANISNRLQLTREIQAVLADNRLVRSRPDSGLPPRSGALDKAAEKPEEEKVEPRSPEPRVRQAVPASGIGIVSAAF